MKKLLSGLAAALLLSFANLAGAGTLTIHDGQPSFQPESSFTDNDISADVFHNPPGVMGDVVRLMGDSQVAPAAESPRILIGGDFSANAGDLFSVIYDFTINLGTPDPITLTIGASTIVDGVQQIFNTVLDRDPGCRALPGPDQRSSFHPGDERPLEGAFVLQLHHRRWNDQSCPGWFTPETAGG